ncbi:MAG: hypothetical protein U0871_23645 [Gemmataceae bacterium]
MAKASAAAGESKTPIIVALVFFVLATLVLGVLTYMAYDQVGTLRAEVKKAQDDKSSAEKLRAQDQGKALLYKAAIGTATQEELDSLKNSTAAAEVRAEHQKLLDELRNRLQGGPQGGWVAKGARDLVGTNVQFTATIDDVLKWPSIDQPPERTVGEAVVTGMARQQLAQHKLATAERGFQATANTYRQAAEEANKTKGVYQAETAAIPGKVTQQTDQYRQREEANRKTFADATSKYVEEQRKAAEAATQKDIDLNAAKTKLEGTQQRLDRMEQQSEERETVFQFDRPVGKVLRRVRGTNLVEIDLGSGDNLPVGQRFTVQPSDAADRGLQSRMRPRIGPNGRTVMDGNSPKLDLVPKGRIEVIEVLGPSLARARISSETDPVREPLMAGDLLYHASWRRGQADKITLFGVFDTNGDGSDDIKALIRDLQRTGIVVGCYFDLEQKKWVDPNNPTRPNVKPTPDTAFAVEGAFPVQMAGDALTAVRDELAKQLEAARQDAREKGVKVVKAREYFPRIGFAAPNMNPDSVNRAYARYLRSVNPAGTEGGEQGK